MKNIQKSIRLSEEIYSAVMNYYGDGFSDKFENFVAHYVWSSRKIDEQIEQKKQQLEQISEEIQNSKRVLNGLRECEKVIDNVLKIYSVTHN